MKSTHPNYRIKSFEFKPKHTKEDIDLIKSMKAEGKPFADIYYELLKRFTNPVTKKLRVHPTTLTRWINQN